jgi:hypothetical protein
MADRSEDESEPTRADSWELSVSMWAGWMDVETVECSELS